MFPVFRSGCANRSTSLLKGVTVASTWPDSRGFDENLISPEIGHAQADKPWSVVCMRHMTGRRTRAMCDETGIRTGGSIASVTFAGSSNIRQSQRLSNC